MKLFHKKKIKSTIDRGQALQCIPIKNSSISEFKNNNGLVVLSYKLNLKPLFSDIAMRFGLWKEKSPMKKLELDEMGTFVWQQIDGKNSVRKISKEFALNFDVLEREAENATAAFLKELGKRGLISITDGT